MSGPAANGPLCIESTYEGGSASLNTARAAVADLVASAGADPESVERARLLVSELITNAVEASPGEPYELDATVERALLTVEVRNRARSRDLPPENQWHPDDVLAARGRGLSIVKALADQVSVRELDGGWLAVTATLPL